MTATDKGDEKAKWDAIYEGTNDTPISPEVHALSSEIKDIISELLPEQASVLEAGCGSGAQSLHLAQAGSHSVTLLDFSENALNQARETYKAYGSSAHYIKGDLFEAGQPEYDLVYNFGVLEHYNFDQQVEAIRAMASRSRKYVAIGVPNKACYWYWLWRALLVADDKWPYGKEVPLTDMCKAFEASGLKYIGQKHIAADWTEHYIRSVEGISPSLKSELVEIHRSGLIPLAERAYLILALGTVEDQDLSSYDAWTAGSAAEPMTVAEQAAALSDNLSITISLRRQMAEQKEVIASQETARAEIEARLEEREAELLQTIQIRDAWVGEKDETLERLSKTNRALEKKLAGSEQDMTALKVQLAESEKARAELDGKVAWKEMALDAAYEQRDGLENQIRAVEMSRSWRITKPLRMAAEASRLMRDGSGLWRDRAAYLHHMLRMRGVFQTYKWLAERLSRGKPVPFLPKDTESPAGEELENRISRDSFLQMLHEAKNAGNPIWLQLPTIDWSVPLYQRPQHIASALGRNGTLVVYPTFNVCDNISGYVEVEENVWLTDDLTVFDEIDGVIASVYSTAYANQLDFIRSMSDKNAVIYEYIDHIDEEISGPNTKQLNKIKDYCFGGGADIVAASAKKLLEEATAAVGDANVCFAPNGVDFAHYANATDDERSLDVGFREFCNNHEAVVGYFGALAPWLWYEMINELTRIRPELGFVFIGPDYHGGLYKVEERENVLLTGSIPYKVLPGYAKKFDVAIIPFRNGEIARTTSPCKLFEYFALEKPVVVTSQMDECTAYQEVFGASDTESFSAMLDEALQTRHDPAVRARLKELALENTWDARAKVMLEAGQKALAERYRSTRSAA